MAPGKSPAFQFYARDFLTGVATMSLAEVGAYVKLLAYQWDAGVVPNSEDERARILGCTKAQERTIWQQVGKKFAPVEHGYQNSRLEEERNKQAEFRRRQSDRGKASAEARTNQRSNAGSTSVEPRPVDSRLKPESNSASAFASSVKDHNTHSARANGHGNGANAPNSLPRDHRFHAICSKPLMRVCLTESTAAKFAEKWGGPPDDAMPVLQRFSDVMEAQVGDGPKGDFLWLTQHFEAFMTTEGRTPVAPPSKPKPSKDAGVSAAIEAWGRE